MAIADRSPSAERGLSVKGEGDITLGELGLRPAKEPVDLIARYQAEATQRNLDTLVTHEADGYHIFRFEPKPPSAVRASTEPAMLEALGRYSEQIAQLRGADGLPPVRVGFGNGFSKGEVHAIQISEDMRTAAAGGGGWQPPITPRAGATMPPQPGRPNGFFFEHESAPGVAEAGYRGRAGSGGDFSLRTSQAKRAVFFREIMTKRVDWNGAKIRKADPVRVGDEFAGMQQINFEVELTVINAPLRERIGISSRQSLLVRVVNFFRRPLAESEQTQINDLILKTLKANAGHDLITGDGMLSLKAELLRKVKPDALQFHMQYGADDLVIVEREAPHGAPADVRG